MGRAPCCSKVGLNRGPWTPEEDALLSKYIEAHGEGNWRALPKAAGLLRCGKSCRLRWVNYLRPNVKRGNISEDEENLIIMLHALLGNRWSLIAARMPGRTDNEIKNYWNTHLSKKLASRGLDPKTHKPIKPAPSPTKPEAPQKDSDCDEPQEAWETTMDMDTSSYSTGSCEELQDYRPIFRKQHSPVVSLAIEQRIEKENNKDKNKNKAHKFDCPSPSSVLNMYSPAASGSNCDSPSSTRSISVSKSNSLSSVSTDSNHNKPAVVQEHQNTAQVFPKDDHAMLEFIDEFLSKDGETDQPPDLFRDDGGASEFWDSLGKIELPSITQSHLWDGLNEFVPPAPVQTPDIEDNILINSSSTPAHFIQDNISELLFCS